MKSVQLSLYFISDEGKLKLNQVAFDVDGKRHQTGDIRYRNGSATEATIVFSKSTLVSATNVERGTRIKRVVTVEPLEVDLRHPLMKYIVVNAPELNPSFQD